MDDRKAWPTIIGITAGALVGIAAGLYIYSLHSHGSGQRLHDAQDIIAHCYDKIREIESGLETLRQPVATRP